MLNRKTFKNLDHTLIIVVALLLILGLLVLSSATLHASSSQWYYVKRQAVRIGIGLILVLLVLRLDYSLAQRYSRFLYVFNLLFLFSVLILGKAAKGSQAWLRLGEMVIQPSELAKIIIIVTLAAFLVKRERLETFRDLIPVFLHVGAPLVLILLQPDLGTALVYLAITLGMVFVAGARPSLLLKLMGASGLAVFLALFAHFKWGLPLPLEDYQLQRLVIFIDPYLDGRGGRGAGWHIIQSLVAVGSGGFWGKGLFQGTQVQGSFLPEQHTDFIFAVVGEELGFIGATFTLLLYFILLYRTLYIAQQARDNFGTLIAVGICSMWGFHVLENIGMSIGIMPITGIPLPFMSYGGSAMLANLLAVGILLNINLRRQKILF